MIVMGEPHRLASASTLVASTGSALAGRSLPLVDEVHLWHVALADVPLSPERIAASLSPSEQERAARFAFPYLTRQFACGRLALRYILAAYQQSAAAELAFGAGERGKPYLLEADGSPSRLEFNVSNAGNHLLVAVALKAVGVDIEAIRPLQEIDEIVERNFSVCERAAYWQLAPEQRPLAFFTGFTRKEAYTKAVGLGLYLPLASFSVTLGPELPARLIEIDGDPDKAASWTLLPIQAPPGHVGALVAQGRVERVLACTWPGLSG
jgi:4'-phosphopantetheinyl transferase